MKMMQQEGEFRPIALVLETEQDALMLWDIVNYYNSQGGASVGASRLATEISNWFSQEAHL